MIFILTDSWSASSRRSTEPMLKVSLCSEENDLIVTMESPGSSPGSAPMMEMAGAPNVAHIFVVFGASVSRISKVNL